MLRRSCHTYPVVAQDNVSFEAVGAQVESGQAVGLLVVLRLQFGLLQDRQF